ncbi:fluoride efflux transporter CrcB [Neomoorella mulderi]|uniref:Fluoride-specific ion channel FluC n=1 Tax=Moorella mulderi DSM 14980 TaxID=1122241 RepID=A0A151AZZ1_9FIRM|nr:fluoride efflux transporter CrcB [Moorella mulderi]KYH32967.1 putative fluoride ion transporter CrcB [Moorella mulderi DSM 14980]
MGFATPCGGDKLIYIYIGIFGFLGAIARFELGRFIAILWPSTFPLGTLIINILGCFAMGFILTYSLERLTLSPELRLGITTGFIGAFTTFSTFSVETITLLTSGHKAYAAIYVLVSTLGGLTAVRAGIILTRIPILSAFKVQQTGAETGRR